MHSYNPKDISIAKLRQSLKDNAAAGTVEKTENFTKLMKRFHPAMRHLFRDRRKLATPWFEMRLNFQRSVAAVSMVGWILGIGDRHVSNLMLDENSGEMVPIDFGIAFDAVRTHAFAMPRLMLKSAQAELLPVPEKVPFRMTQDIVDGLGLTGVDGVFRRCSEELLRVLREQADTIMSILEVLKYDPLQKWCTRFLRLLFSCDAGVQDVDERQGQQSARAASSFSSRPCAFHLRR